MGNLFKSKGGSQSIGQGDHAIGSLTNNHGPVISTSGNQSPAIHGQNVTITYNNLPPDWMQYAEEFGVTKAAIASFFKILEQEKVPPGDLDSKLREIAFRYKELLLRFEAVTSDDPQVKSLKKQAEQAFENGRLSEVEELLDQIDERHDNAIHQLHKLQEETAARLEKEQLGKAENLVSQAKLQRLQYRYEKSAQYFQEAAAALPEGRKKERAEYLASAGYYLEKIARYTEVLRLDEQSLSMAHEIGDRKGQAALLNNISQIYKVQGNSGKALDYLEQSLPISQELGDKELEGVTLNNIALIYDAKGDHPNALKYFEQSLSLSREINDKEGEGNTLSNMGVIYNEQGDNTVALEYHEQALAISREIKDKQIESSCLNNISQVYQEQDKLDAALEFAKQSLVIAQQISDRRKEAIVLNNIAGIYDKKGDYPAALKQYEEDLAIAKEIGSKDCEAATRFNIGSLYKQQGELVKAEQYLSRAVELLEQLEHPMLENARNGLKAVRAKLRGQQE